MKKVIAICGSTRTSSSNLSLIKAIQDITRDKIIITLFNDIASLPHFNPDIDNTGAPPAVEGFRTLINEADGILICTPEYAMGVPGTLKNALDWTVSSSNFSHKPTALITASSSGLKAHQALLGTLQVIEADITEQTQLVISFIKTKINSAGEIIDEKTREEVNDLLQNFIGLMGK